MPSLTLTYPKYIAGRLGLIDLHNLKSSCDYKVDMPPIRKNEKGEWETYTSKICIKRVETKVKLLDIYTKSISIKITCPAGTKETLMYFGVHKSPNQCHNEFRSKLEKEVFKLYKEADMLESLYVQPITMKNKKNE